MNSKQLSPYISFNREDWAKLRFSTPLSITESDLVRFESINERVTMEEVTQIYLPLSRLLNLYVSETQSLYEVTNSFLGTLPEKVPYIIGIAGSVAVGKTTTSKIIQALLSRWPNHPKVDLITTDGFLYPNHVLKQKGIMNKKGFPESYDVRSLFKFLSDVKSGKAEVIAPIYSHLEYDILPNKHQVINQPDILIVEGLNVLQTPKQQDSTGLYISDFFDFTIYVDADEKHIKKWYIDRFELLRRTAFQDRNSYFHRYASLSEKEAEQIAEEIWEEINALNLKANIYPTRNRARLILEKGESHLVQRISLRKI